MNLPDAVEHHLGYDTRQGHQGTIYVFEPDYRYGIRGIQDILRYLYEQGYAEEAHDVDPSGPVIQGGASMGQRGRF